MPRFRPRLSGTLFASCCHLDQSTSPTCATPLRRSRGRWFELEYYLLLLPLWAQRGIEKQGNGPPMHEVCSNEPREYERAFDDLVGIMSQTQQQKSNESDCNLNANGVLRCSQEVIDFQDLFDPSEEQFDCPAPLIQCGDFFRARGQIIREDAQYLAGLDFDLDFAHPLRHRVVARSSKALRKVSNPIAQNRRLCRHRPLLNNCKRSVAFEARYNTAACAMQRRPPAIVVIAEVKYVRCSRFDRHFLGGRNVIHVCRGHMQVKWLVGIGIINDMRLRAANPRRKTSPNRHSNCSIARWSNRSIARNPPLFVDIHAAIAPSVQKAALRTLRKDATHWRWTVPTSKPWSRRGDKACSRGFSSWFRCRADFATHRTVHTASR
jgi:hypothetical protein